MLRQIIWLIAGTALLVRPTVAESTWGLGDGEVIETIGFSSRDAFSISYSAGTERLTLRGELSDITTTEGDVYAEIAGGQVGLEAQFDSETITRFAAPFQDFILYEARFSSVLRGADEFRLQSPAGSANRGGNLLMGNLLSENPIILSGVLDTRQLNSGSLRLRLPFDVTDGDATFVEMFGSQAVDNLDGWLVGNTGAFSADGGLEELLHVDIPSEPYILFNGAQDDFSFELNTGEIIPTHPNPVPEPATWALGLCAVLVALRRRRLAH